MKIIHFAINDPAGAAIAFVKAINRYTPHRARLVTWEIRYNFMFEKDFHIPWMDKQALEFLYEEMWEADIFHFHMLIDETHPVGGFRISDFANCKKILHHHHGHPDFRANPDKYRKKYRNPKRRVLASTPDLLHLIPEALWQPNLVPINDHSYLPACDSNNGVVKVGQAPTRKDLKNTAELVRVASRLRSAVGQSRLELEIIENCLHRDCLERKKRCDIIFDHMQGYYGVSSLESLSQGKPVIAGLDDWNAGWIKRFAESSDLPWVLARNQDELEGQLLRLVEDPDLRVEIGCKSRRFMEEHWTEKQVLKPLLEVYASL
ncbi:MAG: glycosyltransferase [Deltaproteobacteria bacterium]|nr:glycosyltransferase [Deltaproteobacteria bacterium]